ncbi:MAG: RNA 2',3'-cyclic phosphodiesterase [Minisyncoccia bacterium]
MNQRLFIAIKPPEEILEEILKYQKEVSKYRGFRLVEKENLHLTLIFLGYVKQEEVPTIIEILSKISQKYQPFSLNLSLFDYGPNLKSPRLIWLEGEAPKNFISLKREIEKELERNKIAFDKEKRNFKTHITVLRIKKDFLKHLPIREEIIKKTNLNFEAKSFKLMESKLSPFGAQYLELETFNFKNFK